MLYHVAHAATTAVADEEWLHGAFITTIQQRGKAVIDKRGASSAASAANAIVDHVRSWLLGSGDEMVSMGVYTDGSVYGVEAGLIYSLPVKCVRGGGYVVVRDLPIDAFSAGKLRETETELKEERALAMAFIEGSAAGAAGSAGAGAGAGAGK